MAEKEKLSRKQRDRLRHKEEILAAAQRAADITRQLLAFARKQTIAPEVIDLNAIDLNSWFDISRVNDEEDKAMFFASHYLTDELEGFFKHYYFTGEVQFRYDIDTMLVEEIYKLAALSGHLYAGYTFDYLLNKYIDKRMEEEGLSRSQIYYHYNRQKRYLTTAKEEDRFIPLD